MTDTERSWRSIYKAKYCWRLSVCGLWLKLLRLLQKQPGRRAEICLRKRAEYQADSKALEKFIAARIVGGLSLSLFNPPKIN